MDKRRDRTGKESVGVRRGVSKGVVDTRKPTSLRADLP
jgi:hypothetical protein